MNQTSCPCPECLNCCCDQIEGMDSGDCVNAEDGTCNGNETQDDREDRINVLCGCGWGLLNVLESDGPDNCPVCGHFLGYRLIDEE